MDNTRKIVSLDDARPHASKKKRRSMILGIVALMTALGVLAIWLGGLGKARTLVLSDYSLATVSQGPLEKTTEASGTVVIPGTVSVLSPQEGYLTAVHVQEGDRVAKGSALVDLSVPDLEESRDDLRDDIASARLALAETEYDHQFNLRSLETSLQRLERARDQAQDEVDLQRELVTLKSSRQGDLDNAIDALETAQEKVDDALLQLERERYKGALAVEKARTSLRQMEVNLARIQEDIDTARIRSPIDGEILSLSADLEVLGNLVARNTTLLSIANREETFLDFEVNEEYAKVLAPSSPMKVTVGTTTFQAEVTRIGKVATASSDGLTSTVSVRARPVTSVELTPGASAVAVLSLGVQEGVLTLPRGAYLSSGGQKFVYRVEGDQATRTEVTFGALQGNVVEVVAGLKAGDRIISSSYQTFSGQADVKLIAKP